MRFFLSVVLSNQWDQRIVPGLLDMPAVERFVIKHESLPVIRLAAMPAGGLAPGAENAPQDARSYSDCELAAALCPRTPGIVGPRSPGMTKPSVSGTAPACGFTAFSAPLLLSRQSRGGSRARSTPSRTVGAESQRALCVECAFSGARFLLRKAVPRTSFLATDHAIFDRSDHRNLSTARPSGVGRLEIVHQCDRNKH